MSPRDLANALYGLSLLLRFDGRAWAFFDKSPGGFLASFGVALIVAPFHFAHAALRYGTTPTSLAPVTYMVVEGLAYVLTWTMFPFAMMYIVRLLGREDRYFWHMVPYNWFQLPVALPLFACAVLADLQLVPIELYRFVNLAAMAAVAVYTTFIGAAGLRIPVATAMGLVVLDFMLTLLAGAFVARI